MVALAAGLLSTGPAVGGAAAGTAAEALAKLFDHRQGESFEAAFRQTKYIALLVEPLESRGRVLFDASEGLRWEVTEPRALVVDTRGGRIRAGPPGELRELTSAQIGPFASLPGGFSGVFGASAAEIQAAFEVAALAAPGAFRLTPRDEALSRILRSIDLELELESGFPRRVVLVEAGGDRNEIEILR